MGNSEERPTSGARSAVLAEAAEAAAERELQAVAAAQQASEPADAQPDQVPTQPGEGTARNIAKQPLLAQLPHPPLIS